MFERMTERAHRVAQARAERRRRGIAERLRDDLPAGIAVEGRGESVALSGRGLRRRFILDPALRGLLGRLR
jgi:hypothetical protein